MREDQVVGLDIGTTKICAVVSQRGERGTVEIMGVGISPSEGLRRGVVVNIDKTVKSIRRAVEDAEMMAGMEINSAYVGVSGEHIESHNGRGIIAVARGGPIKEKDVKRVIDSALTNIGIPRDKVILHVIPRDFMVDDTPGIRDPIGMHGRRLEVSVHVICASVTALRNIQRCVEAAGLKVKGWILEPLASAEAVLNTDEKDLGVAIADIGGGTTDVMVIIEEGVYHTGVFALGGDSITNLIMTHLRVSYQEAERLKINFGVAIPEMVGADEKIELRTVSGSKMEIPRRQLAEIIKQGLIEIYKKIGQEIAASRQAERVRAGLVLTGGTSLIKGADILAREYLQIPCRIGNPKEVSGLYDTVNSPIYSTGVGLVLLAQEGLLATFESGKRGVRGAFSKLGEFFRDLF